MKMYDLSEMAKKLSITTVGLVDIGSMATLLGVRQERNLYKIIAKLIASNWLTKIERGKYQINSIKIHDFEMANFVYQPSYVSFETVLTRTGINFQYYSNIFVASYVTREIEADGQKISFVKMKDYVLSDTIGIEHTNDVATATKERAFLDRIYVSKDYHFDHLDVLDWDKVFEILPIYRNKRMDKKVNEYFKHYKENNLDNNKTI